MLDDDRQMKIYRKFNALTVIDKLCVDDLTSFHLRNDIISINEILRHSLFP